MASVTTRSHATLRETVFVVIGMSEIRCWKEEETILKRQTAKTQPLCDADLNIYLVKAVAAEGVFIEYKRTTQQKQAVRQCRRLIFIW
jgi:predicted kinase